MNPLALSCEALSQKRGTNIFQLAVLEQQNLFSCGYHALFNCCVVFKLLCTAPLDVSLTTNHDYFMSHYQHWQSLLFQKVELEGNRLYPWTLESVKRDILERLHIRYLLQTDTKFIGQISSESLTVISEFSMASMKNGLFLEEHHLQNLKKTFLNFAQSPNLSHAFLIGSTGHWIAFCVHKHKGIASAFFMDSRNYPLLHIEEGNETHQAEIENIILDYIKKHPSAENPNILERIATHKRYVKETLFAIHVLWECIHGRIDIDHLLLCLALEGIIESFHFHIVEQKIGILDWLCDWYHPATMESTLTNKLTTGKRPENGELVANLRRWFGAVRGTGVFEAEEFKKSDKENVIQRFRLVFERLELFILEPN